MTKDLELEEPDLKGVTPIALLALCNRVIEYYQQLETLLTSSPPPEWTPTVFFGIAKEVHNLLKEITVPNQEPIEIGNEEEEDTAIFEPHQSNLQDVESSSIQSTTQAESRITSAPHLPVLPTFASPSSSSFSSAPDNSQTSAPKSTSVLPSTPIAREPSLQPSSPAIPSRSRDPSDVLEDDLSEDNISKNGLSEDDYQSGQDEDQFMDDPPIFPDNQIDSPQMLDRIYQANTGTSSDCPLYEFVELLCEHDEVRKREIKELENKSKSQESEITDLKNENESLREELKSIKETLDEMKKIVETLAVAQVPAAEAAAATTLTSLQSEPRRII
ncbi:hypothetical protein BGZ46_003666 [Entomortierella lignicola]|nr:hypothetical protein BGZ46_003666 [Entomortierella lignicola]